MENLPVEIIGDILSRVSAARDVVLASAACRKWHQAFHEHLGALSFDWKDWPGFGDLSTHQLEILITRTVFQTTRLHSLHIEYYHADAFSASTMLSWLLHTKRSLKELRVNLLTDIGLDAVDICGMKKLEKLTLVHNAIENVDPNYHRFTSLRSLSLVGVRIFEVTLSSRLAACRKLESLDLIGVDFTDKRVEVKAPDLRRLCITNASSDKLILELDRIEHLHLQHGRTKLFELVCSSTKNLETLEINNFNIPESEFYRLVAKSPKLKILMIWDADVDKWTKAVDLDIISTGCPQLSRMSLRCELKKGQSYPCRLRGSARFENMVYLKLGTWTRTSPVEESADLVEGFVECCPRLRRLVIEEMAPELMDQKDCQVIARSMTRISRIRRKCIDLNVQLEFDN